MRNVVSAVLLVPTTIASLALSILFFVLASVGADLLVPLGILTVVWAATISMWCILLRAVDQKNGGATLRISKRWWYYLVLGACMPLLVFAIGQPGAGLISWAASGWVALTLVHFCTIVYQSARSPDGAACS